jgi:SAM-dependent methyltransferase
LNPTAHDPARWFTENFDAAAREILDFLGGDGIELEGKRVADIGCGDGIIDLGLALKGRPAELVGYDLVDVDTEGLLRAARAAGAVEELPECLRFERSAPVTIPAPDQHFDIVTSWSVFEHVDDPVRLLADIRRVIKPSGYLFIQLWPFYDSEHGGHLWKHYDEPFPHHLHRDETILEQVQGDVATDPRRSADDEYRSLNRISPDDLQRALMRNGFVVGKLKLLTAAVHVPPELAHRSLVELGVGGVELLASPV